MKSLRFILPLLMSLLALGGNAADSGNFNAQNIRVMRVNEAGQDMLAVYFDLTANNHAGDNVGFGAYLYTTSPSNSINVSKFTSFRPSSAIFSRTNFCLMIPYSQVPQSYHSDKLHVLVASYYAVPDGAPWQQDGSWWGPSFTMSQMPVTSNPPVISGVNDYDVQYVGQEYRPASGTSGAVLEVGVKVTVRNRPGKRGCVDAIVYPCDDKGRLYSDKGESVSRFESFDVEGSQYSTVLKIPIDWNKIPASAMSRRLHVLLAPFEMANGKWVQQEGTIWAPEFVPSQLAGGVTPPRPVSGSKPVLDWINLTATTPDRQLKIKVGVTSSSTITATNVFVNGTVVRGVKSVTNDGYDMMINETGTLVEGDNTIRVTVTNAAGTTSEERHVTYQPRKAAPIKKTEPVKDVVTDNLKRLALVVGNSRYPGQELVNTVNDANAMSLKLRSLGFEVIYVTEADRRTLDQKINEFGQRARGYDVALFYYAGHGIQYRGANYLIPVDAQMASESDIEYECTNVNRVLSKLEESGCKMKIIALDACRNNPFERSWHRGAGQGRGLSAINAPVGTFISYATSPGTTASDGQTEHSPYTEALLSVLDIPDLPIEAVFKRVATKVFQTTNQTQTPWYSSSLFEGDFIFNPSK